jgi:hypothetical protein
MRVGARAGVECCACCPTNQQHPGQQTHLTGDAELCEWVKHSLRVLPAPLQQLLQQHSLRDPWRRSSSSAAAVCLQTTAAAGAVGGRLLVGFCCAWPEPQVPTKAVVCCPGFGV